MSTYQNCCFLMFMQGQLVKNKISPVPSAAHVRTLRKGSSDHLALDIDLESNRLINSKETDEDKGLLSIYCMPIFVICWACKVSKFFLFQVMYSSLLILRVSFQNKESRLQIELMEFGKLLN